MANYYLNGTLIPEGSDITLSGFTYPYSWLEGTSQSVRASHGIEKTADVNYDPKYYWDKDLPRNLEDKEEVDADGNPLYVQIYNKDTEQMVDTDKRVVSKGLKTTCTAEIKATTNNLLSPTDFYIIRNAVESTEIPTSVSEYRAAVIAEQDRVTTAISAVNTIEELIEIMSSVNWPKAE